MIEIIQITKFPNTAFNRLKEAALQKEVSNLGILEENWKENIQRFTKTGEGFFLVKKEGQIVGFGTVEQSPDAPPTAGIALVNNCFLIPSERKKGYGNQLFKHLTQFAALHFGLLQLNDACPLRHRMNDFMVL